MNKEIKENVVVKKTINPYIPVVILVALLLMAMTFLGKNMVSEKETSALGSRDSETMQIICPKLSGSADAFLFLHREQAVLIDTGLKEDGDTILALLKENGVTSLDAMILTHYDKDHIGNAARILDEISVNKVYAPVGQEDSQEYIALEDAIRTSETAVSLVTDVTEFQALDASFIIYPPRVYEYEKDTDNNRSLIISIAYKDKKLLFPGDAQRARTKEFLKHQYDGTVYDLLKVNHHGRSQKASRDLVQKLHPSFAILTSSNKEPADSEIAQIMEENGVALYDTKDGTIIISLTKDMMSVTQ